MKNLISFAIILFIAGGILLISCHKAPVYNTPGIITDSNPYVALGVGQTYSISFSNTNLSFKSKQNIVQVKNTTSSGADLVAGNTLGYDTVSVYMNGYTEPVKTFYLAVVGFQIVGVATSTTASGQYVDNTLTTSILRKDGILVKRLPDGIVKNTNYSFSVSVDASDYVSSIKVVSDTLTGSTGYDTVYITTSGVDDPVNGTQTLVNLSVGSATEYFNLNILPEVYIEDHTFYTALNTSLSSPISPIVPQCISLVDTTKLTTLTANGSKSLSGIEFFPNLTSLTCIGSGGKLSKIDLSKNKKLTSVDVSGNALTSLDLSKDTLLTTINCSGNNINQLVLPQPQKVFLLERLTCSDNQLASLDLSSFKALITITCSNNALTSLLLPSSTTATTAIDCNHNKLTSLDVNGCTHLATLDCSFNLLTILDLSKTLITGSGSGGLTSNDNTYTLIIKYAP